MIDLYTTPLGTTARTFFAVEAEKKYRVGEALLVLPSDLLVKQASCESKIQAVNFEYLPNRIVKLNRSLLQSLLPDLPQFGNLKKISRRTQELLVGDLLRQLDKLHGLDYFSKLTGKEGFIKAVTSLLGQLSRSGATQEEITNALSEWEDRNSTYALKDRELSALYNLYRSKLRAKNCYDLEGIYRLAILVLENEAAEVPWQHLYFSEIYHFDGLQRLFLRALAKHCDLGVGLLYEPKRPEIFNAVERSYGYLSGFARLQELEVAPVARSRSLQHLLTALGTGAYQQEDNAASIQFFEACDKEGELRAVLRSIKKQLQQGSVYSDFLVVLRDFNTYSGIRAICDEYGVPVTLAQSSSLGSQSLVEFLRLLLAVAEGGSEAVPAYWRLLKCSVAKLCWHFDGEKLNLLKQKNFYNKLSQLQQDVITASFAEDDALVGELEALQQLVGRVQTRATVAAYGELFKEVLQELALPYKVGKAYSDGKASLCQVKNMAETVKQLVEVLDTLREDYESGGMETVVLSAADFCRLLHSACAERQVVLTEADSNGILFGEAANLQGMLFKHVYIMGLREGEFPRNKNENWIYSDWERTYLSSIGIELDNTATSYAEDKFFFAAVATMATESLTLSWYSDDVAGASA